MRYVLIPLLLITLIGCQKKACYECSVLDNAKGFVPLSTECGRGLTFQEAVSQAEQKQEPGTNGLSCVEVE